MKHHRRVNNFYLDSLPLLGLSSRKKDPEQVSRADPIALVYCLVCVFLLEGFVKAKISKVFKFSFNT